MRGTDDTERKIHELETDTERTLCGRQQCSHERYKYRKNSPREIYGEKKIYWRELLRERKVMRETDTDRKGYERDRYYEREIQ